MSFGAGALKRIGRPIGAAMVSLALLLESTALPAQNLPTQIDSSTIQRLKSQLGSGSGTSGLLGGLGTSSGDMLDMVRQQGDQQIRSQQYQTDTMGVGGVQPADDRYYQPSPIERDYRTRLSNNKLRQFGYDLFNSTTRLSGDLTGEVPNDYVLGIGDQLVINFQGATNDNQVARVNRDGNVIVGALAPIRAAGRTLGAVRADISSRTRQTLLGTNVYTSVGSVHAITVFVGGEVNRPGQYQLTSMADVGSALAEANGVRRTGSLRQVRVVRGGRTISIDLYGMLGIGAPQSVRLQDGDRIIVPVIGPTVAVTGGVPRPGIFELHGAASVGDVLDYAGGSLRPRGSNVSISRIGRDGSEAFVRVTGVDQQILAGDALYVTGGSAGGTLNRVSLRGYVLNEGPRPLPAAPTVRDLLGSASDLREGTYQPMAIIVRRDPGSGGRIYVAINLAQTLNGGDPVALQPNDTLWVFSNDDIAFLNSAAVRQIALGQPNPLPQCKSLERFDDIVRDSHISRFSVVTRGSYVVDRDGYSDAVAVGGGTLAGGIRATTRLRSQSDLPQTKDDKNKDDTDQNNGGLPGNSNLAMQQGLTGNGIGTGLNTGQNEQNDMLRAMADEEYRKLCPSSFEEEPELIAVLLEHAVSISGAVRHPGAYPVAGEVTAQTASYIANGIAAQASDLTLDVTRADTGAEQMKRYAVDTEKLALGRVEIHPGDDLRFNAALPQYESAGVVLSGEVARPGIYTIRKGETLAELFQRAGGLTSVGYPYGTVLTRRSVKLAQEEGFRRTARDLNNALLSTSARKNTSAEGMAAALKMIENLSTANAAGRVVVEADPRVLSARPDLDTLLEGGDAIYVPKKPNFVIVLGDVSNPGAVQHTAGRSVAEYIADAGGSQASADNKRVYIVYPNGLAQPVKRSVWHSANMAVPPGSTIIVPKNLDPLFKLDLIRDIASIVGTFVTSAASIAILANTN